MTDLWSDFLETSSKEIQLLPAQDLIARLRGLIPGKDFAWLSDTFNSIVKSVRNQESLKYTLSRLRHFLDDLESFFEYARENCRYDGYIRESDLRKEDERALVAEFGCSKEGAAYELAFTGGDMVGARTLITVRYANVCLEKVYAAWYTDDVPIPEIKIDENGNVDFVEVPEWKVLFDTTINQLIVDE